MHSANKNKEAQRVDAVNRNILTHLRIDLRSLVTTCQVEGRINHNRIDHIKKAFARLDLNAAIAAQGV